MEDCSVANPYHLALWDFAGLQCRDPQLVGARRDKPQQVGDSGLLFTPIPKDPIIFARM